MRIFFLSLFIIVFFSCRNEVKVPKDILPGSKMEEVMLDLVKADEIVNQQSYADSAAGIRVKRERLYQKVFKIHKVSKEEFKKSLTFYQNRPDLLKIVLDSMYNEVKRENEDSLKIKKPHDKA